MDPEIVSRGIRLHESHAIGALCGSDARVAATEGRKLKIGCAIAENRVGTQPGTLKSPRAPHFISVDGDSIRDGVLVIDLPERVPERF